MKDGELLDKFVRLQWIMGRYFRKSRLDHGLSGNIHSGQGRVLKLLKLKPLMSQTELAELMGMRPQSVGELLAKLEKNGFVERRPSEDDKRVLVVSLTEKGASALESGVAEHEEDDLFSCLSPEEQERLEGYLDRLIEDIDRRFPSGGSHGRHRGRGHWGDPHDGRGNLGGREARACRENSLWEHYGYLCFLEEFDERPRQGAF